MNSNVSSRNQSRNSRLISLNRSPCDCHEGDERYVVSSGRFLPDARAGLDVDECSLPRREIPRTPTKIAKSSRNNLVKSRSSRSLSRSRATNHQQDQDHGRTCYDDHDFEAYADDAIYNNRNNDHLDGDAYLDADLNSAETKLHVLAIKPRVAQRPRDNILFEGDMDLRTTFETTYEALARTRLEYFREYQLSLMQKQQQQHHHQEPKSAHRIMSDEIEQPDVAGAVAESKDPEVSVAQKLPLQTSEDFEDGEISNEVKLMSCYDACLDNSTDQMSLQHQRTTTTNIQNNYDSNNVNNNDDSNNTEIEPKYNDDVATRQNTSYIDPDLSPLIVYDSNMNRLVTVGLRKRSKYRPSTSLRSGANGFFGEARAPSDTHAANEQHGQQTLPCEREETGPRNETADRRKNARNLNNSKEIQQKHQHGSNQDSNQPDGLLQTKRMLNVNSKRKIRDNINLQDHIRGDNLISHSPSPTWDYQQRRHEYLSQEGSEELALNEEVRRISAREPVNRRDNNRDLQHSSSSVNEPGGHMSAAPSHNHNNHPSGNNIISRDATPVNADGKFKLERICQNQSIDIFAAKYLDEEM